MARRRCQSICRRLLAIVSLRGIGVCVRSGENDCGNIRDVEMHATSAELPR